MKIRLREKGGDKYAFVYLIVAIFALAIGLIFLPILLSWLAYNKLLDRDADTLAKIGVFSNILYVVVALFMIPIFNHPPGFVNYIWVLSLLFVITGILRTSSRL